MKFYMFKIDTKVPEERVCFKFEQILKKDNFF